MNIYNLNNFTYIESKAEISYEKITYENINEVLLLRNNSRKKEFYKLLKENKSFGITASINGEIVGYGWVKFEGCYDKFFKISKNKAYLASFFVNEQWRGRSIYPNLISELITRITSIYSLKNIYIAIDNENIASITGAKKVGFVKIYNNRSYRILKNTIFKGNI